MGDLDCPPLHAEPAFWLCSYMFPSRAQSLSSAHLWLERSYKRSHVGGEQQAGLATSDICSRSRAIWAGTESFYKWLPESTDMLALL